MTAVPTTSLCLLWLLMQWQVGAVLFSIRENTFPYLALSDGTKPIVWQADGVSTKIATSEVVIVNTKVFSAQCFVAPCSPRK